MKFREKIPSDRQETLRRTIIDALKVRTFSAKELSGHAGIPEKEVYDHLYHIQKSVRRGGEGLVVTPPECKKCGFVFNKREKLKKPGKCPICRAETIREAFFTIK